MSLKVISAFTIIAFILLQAFIYVSYMYSVELLSRQAQDRKSIMKQKRVAMFTPYALVPGGGEKYFLSSAAVFQNSGYAVDILVRSDNPCRSLMELMILAQSLRVDLNPVNLRIRVVKTENFSIVSPKLPVKYYSVFYLLGNEKFPQIRGIGTHMNIYMCQFPFDMYDEGPQLVYRNLASYQLVILNSQYTLSWYSHLIQPAVDRMLNENNEIIAIPTVKVLHPPVSTFTFPIVSVYGLVFGSPLVYMSKNVSLSSNRGVSSIVMLGRFFEGRQNKGHNSALEMIKQMKSIPNIPKFHLTMVGNVHPSEDARRYVSELRNFIEMNNLYDDVTLLTNAEPEEIEIVLRHALVIWHLTGIEQTDSARTVENSIYGLTKPREDPASYEHFGIAIVEAMGSGCIPVALNKGGVTDIISNGLNGFLADNSSDVIVKTVQILKKKRSKQLEISKKAVKRSKDFKPALFTARLKYFVARGIESHVFHRFVETAIPIVRSLTSSQFYGGLSDDIRNIYAAAIVEPNIHATFEFVVRTIIYRLGRSWPIFIFHSQYNENFVKRVLKDVSLEVKIYFIELPYNIDDISSYNRLMKSTWLWDTLGAGYHVEKVLIFQSDSIMLHGNITPFLKYDYVGAPWNLKTNTPIIDLQAKGHLTSGSGNGGFSLRSVQAMIDVSQLLLSSSQDSENEDVFYMLGLEKIGKYILPDRLTSYLFCREEKIDDVSWPSANYDDNHVSSSNTFSSTVTHLGLHAAWYYTSDEEALKLLEMSLP